MPNASHSGSGPPRTVLHIGAMKTGTTFLQQLLADHRATLAEAGVAVPKDQALALRGLLNGVPAADAPTRRDRVAHGLVRGIAEHPGRTLLSWEFLSFLDADEARRLVAALPGDVDVVLTVRDAARTLPAQWQTTCRNGTTQPWPRFGRAVGAWLEGGRDSRSARLFRRTQDVGAMIAAWSAAVGTDRVTVVTVPPSGADPLLLWRRFAEAGGLPRDLAVRPPARSNPSLGHPSCELLRLLNEALEGNAPEGTTALIRAVVAPDLEARAATEPPVRLDRRGREVAAAWNHRVRAAVTAAGVTVVGDLADLPDRPAPDAPRMHRPEPHELLAAASTARAGLVGLGAAAGPAEPETVEDAVAGLAAMVREVAGVDLTAARRARGRGRS